MSNPGHPHWAAVQELRRADHMHAFSHHHQQELARQDHQIRRMTGELDAQEDLWADLFTYAINFGNLAAGATVASTVTIQADSRFEWMKSTCQGNLTANPPPWSSAIILPITIFITDTGSGRQLMNQALPINLVAGDGKLPFINPEDRIFQPSATIQATAQNFSAVQYDNVWFAFIGRKIFKGSPPPQER